MNPIALNPEEVYAEIKIGDSIAGYISNYISFLNSSSDPTILKYRYQHLLKMDARFEYERYSFGVNLNYLLAVIKPNCEIVTFASMSEMYPKIPFYKMMNANLNLKMVFVYDIPPEAKINAINDITVALKNESLINRLSYKYELKDISNAHIKIESSTTTQGVILLSI